MNPLILLAALAPGQADPVALQKAVTLYASFNEAVQADVAGGEKTLSTRFNDPKEKGKFTFEKSISKTAFRIAKGKGLAGGALECVDVLPNNGRIFFPARDNIAYQKGGWSGAVSLWCKTDPDKLLKTKFCDPIQITQKGANDGGIWFDFNDAKPRDLRMGLFPAIVPGTKAATEADKDAPMVWVKGVGWKADDWHHVVLNFQNLDTGKADAVATLYVDGKKIGEIKDRELSMNWDVDRAGIYVAINFIGLLDELAVFRRTLTMDEIGLLHKSPGVLMKK